MKKLIILTGLLAATTMISAQTDVVTGVMRGKDYGVTYALPKTQIEIEVKVNKITYTPGEWQICRSLSATKQHICRPERILGINKRKSKTGRCTR